MTLAAMCLAGISMPLSFTGPAVALPAIAQDLGNNPIGLNWVTNAFMLTFGSCLMAAGSIADTFGRRRAFLYGMALFVLVTLALALSPNLLVFDLLRAAQGLVSAAAFAGGTAALAQEFEGTARTRAFSVLGTTFGVGLAFGPVIAGSMVSHFGWRGVFASVLLVGVAALLLGGRALRESRDPHATGLDWRGAATFTAAVTLFTSAVLQAPEAGWSSPLVLWTLVTSGLLMVLFVWIENHVERPMLDLSLFRYPRFVGVQFLAAAPAYSYVVLLVLLPVRFIGIEGHDSLVAGQLMAALSGPMVVVPLIAGLLTRWFSPGLISGAGLLICASGLLWLAQCPPGTSAIGLALPMLTIGLGISLPWGLMDGLAVSVVPKERAGMATGIFSTTRVAGEGIALAIVGGVLSALVASQLQGVSSAGPEAIAQAAHRLAIGDLTHAAAVLMDAKPADLVRGYAEAFHSLLYLLAVVTTLSAAMVFGFLSHRSTRRARRTTAATVPNAAD
jgi:MFS family permease